MTESNFIKNPERHSAFCSGAFHIVNMRKMHHMSALSRRSLGTSAATLPALALPAVAVAAVNLPAWQAPALVEQSTKPDRIFAAIEAHRNSIIEMFRADRAYFDLNCNTPEYAAAVAAARPFSDAHTDRGSEARRNDTDLDGWGLGASRLC